MTDTQWMIKGREFANCNCDYGCPCQFNSLPTHGNCEAVLALQIDEGRHGDTRLDGLKVAAVVTWPGPIHEGHGIIQPIVDERATPQQREALLRIMSGLDTQPGATFFQVFSTTYDKVHEPIFAPIHLDVDVDARTARINVPGVVEGRGEPIINPVTKQPHRARIDLPQGFEYAIAEVGRGFSQSSGAVIVDLQNSHAHFAHLHMTGEGVVRPS